MYSFVFKINWGLFDEIADSAKSNDVASLYDDPIAWIPVVFIFNVFFSFALELIYYGISDHNECFLSQLLDYVSDEVSVCLAFDTHTNPMLHRLTLVDVVVTIDARYT